jgi:allantoinase
VESRPKAVENDAVALLIQLCRSHGTRMHVAHLSSSDALAPLYHARMARLPLTAETCPHYLHFVAEDIADGAASCRCDPPIRDRENRELLWAAVANKLIQLVVSDHCASPPRAKREASNDALYGPRGIASIQVSLPVTWTGARERGCTLDQVVDWMCRAPADLAGLSRKGRIDAGYDADLVIFDPDAEFTVDRRSLEPRHSGTPYLGRALSGIVERTYLRGTRIFTRGQQPGLHPSGALLTRH